jgi:hypothetical protein
MSDSDFDRLYRSASANDPARPSAAVRQAILDQASQLAAKTHEASAAEPARGPRWRALLQGVRWQIAAPVAAALLAAIVLAPQWRFSSPSAARQVAAGKAADAPSPGMPLVPAPASARSADLAQTESRPAAPVAAPAPPAALPGPRENAGASSNAAQLSAPPQGEALRQAAARGDLERARALLQQPAVPINARDRNGRTALMLAVMHGQASLVRELLSRGADPNIPDARGRTPLAMARDENQGPLIDALLAAGAR